jgi:hypothetical protein
MNVAAEPVEVGDDDRAGLVDLPGGLERGGELGTAVERVGTLAGLDLGEAMDDVEPLLGGEPGDGLALGFEAGAFEYWPLRKFWSTVSRSASAMSVSTKARPC